jgi:hypothetical protein
MALLGARDAAPALPRALLLDTPVARIACRWPQSLGCVAVVTNHR